MQLTYKILLHKEPEGSYTVSVPALPGCITYGETVEHGIEMAKEAIELYIAELSERVDMIHINNIEPTPKTIFFPPKHENTKFH